MKPFVSLKVEIASSEQIKEITKSNKFSSLPASWNAQKLTMIRNKKSSSRKKNSSQRQ